MPRDGSLAQRGQPQGAWPPDLDTSDTAGCWQVPEQELPPGGTGTMPQGHRWGQLGGPAPRHCPRASLQLRSAVPGRLGMRWHSSASPLSPWGMHQTTGLQTLCGAGSIPGAEPGGNGICWWEKTRQEISFPWFWDISATEELGTGGKKRGLGAASLSPPCPPRSPCCPVSQKRGKQKKKRGAGRSLTETSSNFLGGEKPYSDGKNSRSEVVTKQPAAIRQGPGAWARNKATSLPTQSHGWPGCRGRRCPAEPRAPGCSGRLPRLALEGGQSPLGCPSRGGRLLLGKDLGSAPNPMMAPHGSGAHTGLEVIPDRGMLNFG